MARPDGVEDFDRRHQKKIDVQVSIHPEYAMYLSTRDMGRVGLLMLRNGNWTGKQVAPEAWRRAITTAVTPFDEINATALRVRGNTDRWGTA